MVILTDLLCTWQTNHRCTLLSTAARDFFQSLLSNLPFMLTEDYSLEVSLSLRDAIAKPVTSTPFLTTLPPLNIELRCELVASHSRL